MLGFRMKIIEIDRNNYFVYEKCIVQAVSWSSYQKSTSELLDISKSFAYDSNRALIAYVKDDVILGIIALKNVNKKRKVIQLNGVDPDCRGKGIGKAMVDYVRIRYSNSTFVAETDKDSLGFYRKIGFSIQSLGFKYPDVERFLCTIDSKR